MIGTVALALTALAIAQGGPGEARATGVCSGTATAALRLKSDDGRIEVRFAVEHARAGNPWRIVLVQERRVAWRGTARIVRLGGSFELRRQLRDLPGADTVTASAWGPRGSVCRVSATLPGD
jgi:hypothetical protein